MTARVIPRPLPSFRAPFVILREVAESKKLFLPFRVCLRVIPRPLLSFCAKSQNQKNKGKRQ
jgi:hypothetical protein